ncbi:MAG TPA: 3-isopropylmalate dehydratase small subunit [Blastococcus sp.]|jgi:3-isopropylmalate/(R)-2-methylmalate dehydratase small subunit
MDAFTTHTGTAVPLRRSAVDTDQIIPAEYLKRITRTGFADGLFKAWRTNEPDFVLNQPQYADASVLVAGPDFGTGSSREHAVWALLDGGFRAVISSRFADIFRNNSTKAGLLTVVLPQGDVEALWAQVEADPATQVTVDLQAKQVTYGTVTVPFEIDDYTRWRLLEGLDDVGLTERNLTDIETFEAGRPAWLPKAQPVT